MSDLVPRVPRWQAFAALTYSTLFTTVTGLCAWSGWASKGGDAGYAALFGTIMTLGGLIMMVFSGILIWRSGGTDSK